MPVTQLQHAALAPYLWRHKISRSIIEDLNEFSENIETSPFEERYIAPEPLNMEKFYADGDTFLVPGRRFMLVGPGCNASVGCNTSIDLYDFGFPREVDAKERRAPVASVQIGDRLGQRRFTVAQRGRETLRTSTTMTTYDRSRQGCV